MSVTANGVQGALDARDWVGIIEGQYHGCDRGEVGGIFEHAQVVGAIGASRRVSAGGAAENSSGLRYRSKDAPPQLPITSC